MPQSRGLLAIFLLSGFAALVYQVVWQRALFAIFGIDTASVTIVVAAFMLGLGIGSHLGGELSKRYAALPLFAAFEVGIGTFGFFSLRIFELAAQVSLGWSRPGTAFMTFLLVLVPTTLMGATLPLLVAHAAKASGNTGRSVGMLYFVNTLGAALSCFATVYVLLGRLGMAKSTYAAAALNVVLGVSVLALMRRTEVRA
jgi:predicted membrane-bound spermidine synthase